MTVHFPLPSVIAIAVLQVVGVIVGGPLLVGLMRKVRCRLEGRAGPPIRQPLLDLRKLMRKERISPDQASWVFSAAPLVLVGSVAVASAITPLVATDPAFGWSADLFAVVFLLLLGSVALALGALDTGTAFGGMGASRAVTIGALSEPALLVSVLALSIPARSSNLPTIVSRSLEHPAWLASPQRLLAVVALVIVIVAECGRLPVDNPSTHLELTMIHEAMILEYAGPDLALIKLAEAMRLGFLVALLATLFIPWGIATAPGPGRLSVGLVAAGAKVAVVGVALAAGEVLVAKLRLFRVPELMAGAFVLSVLAVISVAIA
jgi:formate hydrogenlyase subunit 4